MTTSGPPATTHHETAPTEGPVVILRPMTDADIEPAAALETRLFADSWSPTIIAEEVGHPTRRYVVAESDGAMVGYAGLWLQPDDAEVMTLGVAPEFRRRGIGQQLLDYLLGLAGLDGAGHVFLEVRADNVGAQQLYLRNGFVQIGIRKRYYAPDGCDAFVMRKTLTRQDREGETR